MTPEIIRRAIREAEALIAAAKTVLTKVEVIRSKEHGDWENIPVSKDTGTLRRRSMDLTRTLAELRGRTRR
jgi:hypothetical protein